MSKAKLHFEVHVYSNYDPMVLERYHDGRQLKTVSLFLHDNTQNCQKRNIKKYLYPCYGSKLV